MDGLSLIKLEKFIIHKMEAQLERESLDSKYSKSIENIN